MYMENPTTSYLINNIITILTAIGAVIYGLNKFIGNLRQIREDKINKDLNLESMELDNESKELENNAKEITVVRQLREELVFFIQSVRELNARVSALEVNVHDQRHVIDSQAEIIDTQSKQIESLLCELRNYITYTKSLITQMKNAKLIPLSMKDISELEDCSDINKNTPS